MKIYLGELENIIGSMREIIEKEMPIKTSFKFSKAIKKLDEEAQLYDEKRSQLIQKFAQKNESGEIIQEEGKVTINNMPEFQKEITELNSIEVNLDIEKISINDLGDIDISPKTLLMLDKILED